MSEPKHHHFVPRFHLRRFADVSERVSVRVRDGATYTTMTRNVMSQMGLYRVPGKPLTAEFTLGNFEAQAADAVATLCSSGALPRTGAHGRVSLALFMALQLSRTPDMATRLEFAHDVVDATGSGLIDQDEMRIHLEERVLGFRPRDGEVVAACDLVNYEVSQPDFPDRAALAELRIQLTFDLAVQHVAPHLESRLWSIEVSRKGDLITSDRPVTLWNPPSQEDGYRGVGIFDATEVWFPVDPTRMLVLRKDGLERVRRIGPQRVALVNRHIARHCTSRIVFHPSNVDAAEVPLARRRPTMRFWEAPAIDGRSGRPMSGEVLQVWSPIRDIPDDVTDPYAL